MIIARASFRLGFYAGLLVVIVLGIYLLQLWQADRQVELHSAHLLHALEQKDWSGIAEFIDAAYKDQWGDDRALVLSRLRQVIGYTRHLHVEAHEPVAFANGGTGEWRARVTITGDDNEVMTFMKQRINTLAQPFRLEWQRRSWKPWDWKLVRVTNPSLELPEGADF